MAHGLQSWLPRLDPILAAGRQVVQFAAGLGVMYGVLRQVDATSITDALFKIGADLADIIKEGSIVASVAAGVWATYKATHVSQVRSVQAAGATVITPDPIVAVKTGALLSATN